MHGAASSMSKSSNGRRSQRRAQSFRRNSSTGRAISILEETGVRRTIHHRGRLNLITHTATLNALEKQSLRFANRQLTPNQLDFELTTAALTNSSNVPSRTSPSVSSLSQDHDEVSLFVQQNQELLSPIGLIPCSKREGSTRLYYENLNGMPPHISGNAKLEKIMGIIDDMEIDVFAYNEHKITFSHPENRRSGLSKLFNGGETLTLSTGGNFSHPVARLNFSALWLALLHPATSEVHRLLCLIR